MFSSFFGGTGMQGNGGGFEALAQVRGYWEALRAGGDLPPERAAVDPRGLSAVLESVFIADRVAPGVARFRLAGAAISELMGMDVRGMPLLSLIDPPARAGFAAALETALTAPAILEMSLEAERGIGRPALSARLLMLPLRRADGSGGLALGCLALAGATGRSPRRFALAAHHLTPMPGAQVQATTPPAAARVAAPARGMAEPAAAFRHTATARPYLRLVKTDRDGD